MFLVGLFLAVILTITIFWPDQEASVFDRTPVKLASLSGMRCPIMITPQDDAEVSVTITNTHVRPTTLRIRSRIAEATTSLFREDIQQIDLEPDEAQTLSWPIFMEDAVFDYMVMARIHQFQRTPFPASSGSCGVMALNIPLLAGSQVVLLLFLVAAVFLAVGIVLWLRSDWPLTGKRLGAARRGLIILIAVLLGLLTGLLQMPTVTLIMLILSAVFLVSLLERLV